jgi:hypothetical protein
MAHGGKREGAGRKLGAVTKRTREIADRALAEGKSPLEVMLDNMRHFQQVALDAEAVLAGLTVEEIGGKDMSPDDQFKMLLAKAKNAAGFRQMAQECARDAASYIHPKLTAVAHTGPDGGPIKFERIELIGVRPAQDT